MSYLFQLHACMASVGLDSLVHHQPPKSMQCAWKTRVLWIINCYHVFTCNHLAGSFILNQKINLKKFIILIFESSSISEVVSNACCMWCNHLSAAWCVTGNGRCRPIRAGCPAIYQERNQGSMFEIQKLSWWIEAVGPNQNDTNTQLFAHISWSCVFYVWHSVSNFQKKKTTMCFQLEKTRFNPIMPLKWKDTEHTW
jgi:hypothetical protein